jgi:hypothetical protein
MIKRKFASAHLISRDGAKGTIQDYDHFVGTDG